MKFPQINNKIAQYVGTKVAGSTPIAHQMKYYCDNSRHLICIPYSIENLHQMAKDLQIKKCWFHNAKYPHYDIPKSRIEEIKSKCIIISSKELLKLIYSSL